MQESSHIDAMDPNTHSAVVSSVYWHDAAHLQHEHDVCQTFMGPAALSSTCPLPDRCGLPPLLACSAHPAAQHINVQKP